MDPTQAIASFFATLLAFIVTQVAGHVITRALDAQHLSRDALADLTSTLTSIEGALQGINTSELPTEYAALRAASSGWDLSSPSIKLERLLGAFHDDQIHRLAMLFYDRYDQFVRVSKQHEDAYFWLLDHPEADWTQPQAGERFERLKVTRSRMADHARDMLRFGYELGTLLFRRSKRLGLPTFLRPTTVDDFLSERLGLSERSLRDRSAFYALTSTDLVFDPRLPYSIVRWGDEAARLVKERRGCLSLDLEYDDANGAKCAGTVAIPPLQEVALPASAVPKSGRIWWPGMANHGQVLRKLPARIDRLPNDGDDRVLLTLDPADFGTVSRLLHAKPSLPALPSD